jgi:hypothetical protein
MRTVARRRRDISPERRDLARIYTWAFLVRALAGLVAYVLTFYTEVPFLEDALFYEEKGYGIAREWLLGRSVDLATEAQGVQSAWLFVLAIAAFYYLADGIRLLPVLFVAYSAITALAPVYVYGIARELGAGETVARRAGWLVALSPAFVFWSGSLYKEGLTLLLLSIGSLHILRLQSRWRIQSVFIVGVCVLGLWGVRYYLAVLLIAAGAAGLTWRRATSANGSNGLPVFIRQAGIAAGFVALIIGLGLTESTERSLVENDQGLLVELDTRRYWSAREAGSGYLQEERIATPDDAARFFPLGLLYFLTVPFPWQVGALRQNLIIPENLFWLMLYPLIVVGMARARRSNLAGTFFIILFTVGMCAIYALLAANVGTAYRMRSQVWLLWAPFAAWGWEIWRQRWSDAREARRQARNMRLAARRRRFLSAAGGVRDVRDRRLF